jgi:arginase
MRKVEIILVPYDSGNRDWRTGAGPYRIAKSGLSEALRKQEWSVQAEVIQLEQERLPEIQAAFAINRMLAVRVSEAVKKGIFPLVLSGNCNCTLGVVAGLDVPDVAVAWFDAHGDFNTPQTTPSGFFDGMALATLTGRCWRTLVGGIPGFFPVSENHCVLLGARDLDSQERYLLRESSVSWTANAKEAVPLLKDLRKRASSVHVHIDLDVLDPSEGPASNYAVPEGFLIDELLQCLELIRKDFTVCSAVLAAYEPATDPERRIAEAAVRIAATILG